MNTFSISDSEFAQVQRFIFDAAGISLADAKKPLVVGRLSKRLTALELVNYGQYLKLLMSGQAPEEVQLAVDLLTTNETYFFREMKHFDFLREQAKAARGRGQPYRVWSSASSSGEEAYSIAMVLADCLDTTPWEIVGTDISTRMIENARRGLYTMDRGRHIPPNYLRRFCAKGSGQYEGQLLVDRNLRSRVSFQHANLNEPLPHMGQFDVAFLRNVLIYFNTQTKREVVARVVSIIKPGGYFCVGHSESLNDISHGLKLLAPSIYQKPI